jgi:DNA-binding transcriptional ArsR family regulator
MNDPRSSRVFHALSDATRREVLQKLSESQGMSATELAESLPVSRQAVSKHLYALAAADLIAPEQRGREKIYRVTPEALNDAMGWMAEIGARWDDRLASLERHLKGRGRP